MDSNLKGTDYLNMTSLIFSKLYIIIAMISIAPYLSDKGEHTMLYNIEKTCTLKLY